MIVPGYLGLVLVVSVGAVLLATAAARASRQTRLFLRSLRWGVATGAVTGAVVGALELLVSEPRLVPVGLFFGALVGALISLVPTLIGAVFVADLLGHRHEASQDEVQRHLTPVFGAVVGVLDVALLVGMLASGAGIASVADALPFIVAGNGCAVLMLCRARTSLGRLAASAR